jgi:sugar phosphate isomerase/epimerase
MLKRRELLKLAGIAGLAGILPVTFANNIPLQKKGPFRFCLNTSTISGQKPGLLKSIEIAAIAGYDGLELWVNDIKEYIAQGNTIESLAEFIRKKGLEVEDAISFTTWMSDDNAQRKAGLDQLETEMKMMAVLGCKRIAAPPAGVKKDKPVDLFKAGSYYREALILGRKTGVMPQLEFWGASGTLFQLGQAMAIAASANDPDARILPDVYHLFKGGSGFEGLKLLSGKAIEVIHMNDYLLSKPVSEQTDADRVYPGDGNAPLIQILRDLNAMGGTKVLSLELFNKTYWQQDPQQVAKTGLEKMKILVSTALA